MTPLFTAFYSCLFISLLHASYQDCEEDEDCLLHCNDVSPCNGISYNCGPSNLKICSIQCETTDSCSSVTITSSRNTNINCSESHSCSNLDVMVTNHDSSHSINAFVYVTSKDNTNITMQCEGNGISECSLYVDTPANQSDIACTDCTLSCNNNIECDYHCSLNDCIGGTIECKTRNNCNADGKGKDDIIMSMLNISTTTFLPEPTTLESVDCQINVEINGIKHNQTLINALYNDDQLWDNVQDQLLYLFKVNVAYTTNNIYIGVDIKQNNISTTLNDGTFRLLFIIEFNSNTVNTNDLLMFLDDNDDIISTNITNTIINYIVEYYPYININIHSTKIPFTSQSQFVYSSIANATDNDSSSSTNNSIFSNIINNEYFISICGFIAGLICMCCLIVVPVWWYIRRQEIDRQNKRRARQISHQMSMSGSRLSRLHIVQNNVRIKHAPSVSQLNPPNHFNHHSSIGSLSNVSMSSMPGIGGDFNEISSFKLQTHKPEVIRYLLKKHARSSSIALHERTKSINESRSRHNTQLSTSVGSMSKNKIKSTSTSIASKNPQPKKKKLNLEKIRSNIVIISDDRKEEDEDNLDQHPKIAIIRWDDDSGDSDDPEIDFNIDIELSTAL